MCAKRHCIQSDRACLFNIPLSVFLCVIDCVLQVGMNTGLANTESLLPGEMAGLETRKPCFTASLLADLYMCLSYVCLCLNIPCLVSVSDSLAYHISGSGQNEDYLTRL